MASSMVLVRSGSIPGAVDSKVSCSRGQPEYSMNPRESVAANSTHFER